MPPTMGRPLVVSSTVFKSLRALVLLLDKKGEDLLPPKKSATAVAVVVSAAAEESCHCDIDLELSLIVEIE
jgi:hypothetical protein